MKKKMKITGAFFKKANPWFCWILVIFFCLIKISNKFKYEIKNLKSMEGCNWGHGLSAAIKLGSLEKTVIASLFHSALRHHFFVEKTMPYVILGNDRLCRFLTRKKTKTFDDAKLIFWSFATFFVPTIFWSGAKQRFCFGESMSVLDQNGRIQALGFLARWRLIIHSLYYKIP